MNKKELLIISLLRENARESLTNISKRTKIPISTIYEKLRNNYGNIIQRHVALIDFALLGYNVRANIMVSTQKDLRLQLKDYLVKQFEVNSVYKINNGFDYLVEGVFKDIREVEDFVERLEEQFKIDKKQINYIIEDLKRESFMADPKTVEMFH
ncbi:MAG: Lrp/AsnC family transcriptional regulator [Candidatus Woesearchaeota archaeon]